MGMQGGESQDFVSRHESARPDGQRSEFDSLLPTHMESPGPRGEPQGRGAATQKTKDYQTWEEEGPRSVFYQKARNLQTPNTISKRDILS